MVARGLSGVVLLLYPFIVYVGLTYGGWPLLCVVILILATLRLVLCRACPETASLAVAPAAAAIALAAVALLSGARDFLLYYPVAVSAAMLALFSLSLRYTPTAIERLARLRHPDLPPSGVIWTRRVTIVWCLFFVANGAIALRTIQLGDLELWTLYNGVISYIAIGTLIIGEIVARRIVMGPVAS
jgi:uncharacterized membrane protein